MTELAQRIWRDDEGVTAIEYGLIAALVAIVIIAALQLAGTNLRTLWEKVRDCMIYANGGAIGACPP